MIGLRRPVRRRRVLVCAAVLALGLAAVLPAAASADNTLVYQGGLLGITGDNSVETGVMTKPITYLVFWGSQWGSMTPKNGFVTFSKDPSGTALYMQRFLEGMGSQAPMSNGATWDGIVTQYCQGFYRAGVPFGVVKGNTSCPSGDPGDHVGYPRGGELTPSRVWYDNSAQEPVPASGDQLANEATAAAKHFKNTTEAQNLNAQYVIMSPTGTNPDNLNQIVNHSKVCAWHDYTLDASIGVKIKKGGVATPYGNLAFTNMPYDAEGCFSGSVTGGQLDGLSITESHEYAETVTDPEPGKAWYGGGGEIGDECENLKSGTLGGPAPITYSNGVFPVQGLWSNSNGACVLSDPTVP